MVGLFRRYLIFCFPLGALWSSLFAQIVSVEELYHNTTSHYNAYFVAHENYLKLEAARYANEVRNYIAPLSVYPLIDTLAMASLQEDIDNCIQKSSLVLHYHPKNKWSDQAYLLLGHGRMYDGDWQQAEKAYRYVARYSEANDMRNAAWLALMHLYIQDSLIDMAAQVRSRLERSPPSGSNQYNFLCMQAFWYGRQRNYAEMVPYLEAALPLSPSRAQRVRLHFLLAQLYARTQEAKAAYVHFKRAMRRNIPTDLLIQAELNRLAYTKHFRPRTLKRKRRAFHRRLRERKFKDIQDQVYYSWAVFEDQNGYKKEAILRYSLAAQHNEPRTYLGSRSYLRIGEIYYTDRDYVSAAAYYDSAMMDLPRWEENYAAKAARSQALQAFVKPYLVIQKWDSLLLLASLPAAELDAHLRARAQKLLSERAAEKKRRARAEKKESRFLEGDVGGATEDTEVPTANLLSEDGDGTWYFYNSTQRSTGFEAFRRRWGGRPLADHWRRTAAVRAAQLAQATEASAEEKEKKQEPDENEPNNVKNTDKKDSDKASSLSDAEALASEIASLKEAIPLTEGAQQEALREVEEASVALGKIYYFQLKEPLRSAETYQGFIRRFVGSRYTPQVLYLLMQNPALSEKERLHYKDSLVHTFPDSLHAKLALNPNYLVERAQHTHALQARYRRAYAHYEAGDFEEAQDIIDQARDSIPENSFEDYAELLSLRTKAELTPLHLYVYRLHAFLVKYPKSTLRAHVSALIASAERIQLISVYSSRPVYLRPALDAHYLFGLQYPCAAPKDKSIRASNPLTKEARMGPKNASNPPPSARMPKKLPNLPQDTTALSTSNADISTKDTLEVFQDSAPDIAKNEALEAPTYAEPSVIPHLKDSLRLLIQQQSPKHAPAHLRIDYNLCVCIVPFFQNKAQVLDFYENALAEWDEETLARWKVKAFIISEDNMETLFLSKGWNDYWRYYTQHEFY